jgi:hypothetical protein
LILLGGVWPGILAQTTPPQFASLLTTSTDYTTNTSIFVPQQATGVSSFSVGSSNVITLTLSATAPSGYVAGAALTVTGLSTTVGQLINGIPYTIISASGTAVTMSSPMFVHATATTTTDSGTAALAWNNPTFGGSYTDPTWGTTTYKVPLPTDCPVTTPNPSGICAQNTRGWTNDYTKVVSWSGDGHFYMMMDNSAWLYLYDASSGPPYTFLRRINTGTLSVNPDASAGQGLYGDPSDWNFSNVAGSHTLYWLGTPSATGNRTQLKSIDPSNWSAGATIIRDFATEVTALGGDTISMEREGNFSDDDNIWSFNVKLISSGTGKGIIRWNRSTNTAVTKSFAAGGLCGASACPAGNANWVGTSPSGKYTIVQWNNAGHGAAWTRGTGTEIYEGTTLAFDGIADASNGHGDVGYDVNGVEVYVSQPDDIWDTDLFTVQLVNLANIQTTVPTCSSGVNCNSGHLPIAGARTVYFPCTYNYIGCTLSGPNFRDKDVLISMRATQGTGMGYMLFSPLDVGTDNTGSGGWGANEFWAVQIDWATAYTLPNDQTIGTSAVFYRITRAHSYGAHNDYFSQINASPDKTFHKIAFTTNYDTNPSSGVATHAAEFVILPAGASVASIALAPTTASLVQGLTSTPFSCTATLTDSTTEPCPSPVWSSATTGVATINSSSGLITGVSAGTSVISATSSGFTTSPTATITVTAPVVSSIAIAPTSCSLTTATTCTEVCTATLNNSTTTACTSPVFTSAAPATATVGSSTGLVTGVAAGSTTVHAVASGFTSNNSNITVTGSGPIFNLILTGNWSNTTAK